MVVGLWHSWRVGSVPIYLLRKMCGRSHTRGATIPTTRRVGWRWRSGSFVRRGTNRCCFVIFPPPRHRRDGVNFGASVIDARYPPQRHRGDVSPQRSDRWRERSSLPPGGLTARARRQPIFHNNCWHHTKLRSQTTPKAATAIRWPWPGTGRHRVQIPHFFRGQIGSWWPLGVGLVVGKRLHRLRHRCSSLALSGSSGSKLWPKDG